MVSLFVECMISKTRTETTERPADSRVTWPKHSAGVLVNGQEVIGINALGKKAQ